MTEERSYVINVAHAAETARLWDQARLFVEAMGGLLPEPGIGPEALAEVLDIGCGSAYWANELAHWYPRLLVTGIDIDAQTVKYAWAQARTQYLENVEYLTMDAKQPLDFPENRFDLVNLCLAIGYMDVASWPRLIAECLRILRPGGILRLTEMEVTLTNGQNLNMLNEALYQALYHDGRTFGFGATLGITHMQGYLLEQAGFVNVEKRPFVIDASYEKPLYHQSIKDIEVFYPLVKPFLLRQGTMNDDAFDLLYQGMLVEVLMPGFLCLSYGLTTYGTKPARGGSSDVQPA